MWMRAFLPGHAVGGGEIYRNLFFRIFFVSGEDSFGVCVFYQIRMIKRRFEAALGGEIGESGNEKLNFKLPGNSLLPFLGWLIQWSFKGSCWPPPIRTSRCHFESPGICMFEDVDTSFFSIQFGLFPGSRCLRRYSLCLNQIWWGIHRILKFVRWFP